MVAVAIAFDKAWTSYRGTIATLVTNGLLAGAKIIGMIDEELTAPEAFALAVRARASFLARQTLYEPDALRPYSSLTLLLGVELDDASEALRTRGLRGAWRWAVTLS